MFCLFIVVIYLVVIHGTFAQPKCISFKYTASNMVSFMGSHLRCVAHPYGSIIFTGPLAQMRNVGFIFGFLFLSEF